MVSLRSLFFSSLLSFALTQDLGVVDDTDNGPYTYPFCNTAVPACKNVCQPGSRPIYRPDTKDLFPDYELTMSNDELQRYHSLQQEYLVHFLQNPMYNQPKEDLPYCGSKNTVASRLMRRSRPDWDEEVTAYKDSSSSSKPACLPDTMTVTINFNIMTTNSTTNYLVPDKAIDDQLELLQTSYKPLGISLRKGAVTRYARPEWRDIAHNVTAQSVDDLRTVIGGVRRGGYDELNVFVVEKIGDISCDRNVITRTDGFCTYPEDNDNNYDGCFIDIDSLPGIGWRGQPKYLGNGETLVHEVGHWFGLRHVYDSEATDDSCHTPDSYYAGTPTYAGSDNYDPFQTQCCADDQGKFSDCGKGIQHVTNWMSYSDDRGMSDSVNHTYPWTEGQRAAMFASFYYFRRGTDKVKCSNGDAMYKESAKEGDDVKGLAQDLLSQPVQLLDTLKKLCAASSNNKIYEVDAITGAITSIKDAVSGWERLGAWRWVIVAAIVVGAIVVAMGFYLCVMRKKGKVRSASSYMSLMGGGNSHEMQRQRLKDMIVVQTRSADEAAEPFRAPGVSEPYRDHH